MWEVNARKCLKLFDDVYVSSDDLEILKRAEEMGAIPIVRPEELCGDTPNIPVYKHSLIYMGNPYGIVAVQANSPTIQLSTIMKAKIVLEEFANEVMTCHPDYSIYGSVWALTADRILNYGDPYKPTPEVLLVDPSTDIHTEEDLIKALNEQDSFNS